MNKHQKKWLLLAPLGLATIGFGTSLTAQAAAWRERGDSRWFWLGTAGLCVLNVGVSLFGDAVKERVLYEIEPDTGDLP